LGAGERARRAVALLRISIAKTVLDVPVRPARSRPGPPARCRRHSPGARGIADGRFVVTHPPGSGDSGSRDPVADRFVDAARRHAHRGRGAGPCHPASCRGLDVRPFGRDGRCARDARAGRLFPGCASVRTKADPDSSTLIPPSCDDHSPRKGCGPTLPSRRLAQLPSRVVEQVASPADSPATGGSR
jgi:hypothetical protein